MAEPSDHDLILAILTSCQYGHVKLDRIIDFLEDDGEEEEEDDQADG